MLDRTEVARVLDILGNRNRRRIIELLRQKPCFVTEIADRLVISPKAVIEHLQLMEREEILSSHLDERRRKYYFLENDILVDVSLRQIHLIASVPHAREMKDEQLRKSVVLLGRMIQAHDQILGNLEQVNRDIETKIADLAENHKDLFASEREITVIIALSHEPLTFAQIVQVTGIPGEDLAEILDRCQRRGIVGKHEDRYAIRGIHAK